MRLKRMPDETLEWFNDRIKNIIKMYKINHGVKLNQKQAMELLVKKGELRLK